MLWLEKAEAVKRDKAVRRKLAAERRAEQTRTLPERIAAQVAMVAEHGGRLPPRWRYEDATKVVRSKKDGRGKPAGRNGKQARNPAERVKYRKKVANRPAYIPMMPYDPAIDGTGTERMYARAAERRERIDHGFRLREDIFLSGHIIKSGLTYDGLKSEQLGSDSALRWPALVHKARTLRVCWHRDSAYNLRNQITAAKNQGVPDWMLEHGNEEAEPDTNFRVLESGHYKVLLMDAPTVEGNKKLLGFLRLDTDFDWNSVEALLEALREKVASKKLASLPNFVVGIRTEDGRLIRPHLIWLLPINRGVLNREGTKPLKKFKSVYYGLCRALADLGADPQAPATSQLTKNPLSPLYHTVCPTDDWLSLDQHAECLDMGLDRMTLIREAVAKATGETFQHSNEFWNGCWDAARALMAKWHHNRDPYYEETRAGGDDALLIDRLQEALSSLVVDKGMRARSMEYARHKIASFIVGSWDPTKLGAARSETRGRLAHLVADIRGTQARQAFAGRYSARMRSDRTLESLIEAWDRLANDGEPSKSALAREAELARQTVHNRYGDLMDVLASRGVKNGLMLYRADSIAEPKNPFFDLANMTDDDEENRDQSDDRTVSPEEWATVMADRRTQPSESEEDLAENPEDGLIAHLTATRAASARFHVDAPSINWAGADAEDDDGDGESDDVADLLAYEAWLTTDMSGSP